MYGHPYKPYEIQNEFMRAMYATLSDKKVGIFESPTGTGKTSSSLCPSVAWLRNASERQLQAALAEIDAGGGPEWARKAAKDMKIAEFKNKQSKTTSSFGDNVDRYNDINLQVDENDSGLNEKSKIFFVSRTHSQLTQVAEALQRLKVDPPPKFVTLGSRKQLCIHPEVRKLGNVEQMNDKCLDIQRSPEGCEYKNNIQSLKQRINHEIMDIEDSYKSGKQECSCPYYATREALPTTEVVAVPYPLLLVAKNRESLGIDSQNSVVIIDEAHNLIDTLTALHSSTLSLSVIERASHGLNSYLHALGTRSGPDNRRKVQQVIKSAESLQHYFKHENEKSKRRPGIAVSVRDLFSFGNVDTLDSMSLNAFAQESKSIFKSESYTRREEKNAKIERNRKSEATCLSLPPPAKLKKLNEGNADKYSTPWQPMNPPVSSSSSSSSPSSILEINPSVSQGPSNSLGILLSFVLSATHPGYEGRLYHDIEQDTITGEKRSVLRFLSLDPAPLFEDIVNDAKCVVSAGGTMEPMADFTTYLLPEDVDVGQFSYGHIVPKSQSLVAPLSDVKFTFANRGDTTVISELGKLMIDIVGSTPNGVVAFFPGYSFLLQVLREWQKSGIWNDLKKSKRVFYETASAQGNIFEDYSKAAVSERGALLLSVVGGRLSEGINFSDELARAVVMVGLPFPNAMSAEMVAKREFIEHNSLQRGDSSEQAKEHARQYYENMAMRAVNQSVGRAIRHKDDFAAIYLIDARYKTPSVQSKSSKWVRDSIDMNVGKSKIHTFWQKNKSL